MFKLRKDPDNSGDVYFDIKAGCNNEMLTEEQIDYILLKTSDMLLKMKLIVLKTSDYLPDSSSNGDAGIMGYNEHVPLTSGDPERFLKSYSKHFAGIHAPIANSMPDFESNDIEPVAKNQ